MCKGGEVYEKGLVSVVTPVFNGEKFVSRLLQSILDQTYPQVEMILVDDGSEDGTVLVAESYRKRFSQRGYRYEIIRARHKNASGALNQGLPHVRGEYLIWPDSDDRLERESIEARVRFLTENPSFHCVRSLPSYFNDRTGTPMRSEEGRGDLKKEDLFWDVLEGRTFVSCGCYMLRSQRFFEIYPGRRIPEYEVGQNFQMLLPFLYRYPCPTIEQELYAVAVREGSASRRARTEREEQEAYRAFELLLDEIAAICGIWDRASRRRILRWKLRRRRELARRWGRKLRELRALWQLFWAGGISCRGSRRLFCRIWLGCAARQPWRPKSAAACLDAVDGNADFPMQGYLNEGGESQ